VKLTQWIFALAVLTGGSSAFAQFRYSNCQSPNLNVSSSGFLDASSVLLFMQLKVSAPIMELAFDMISPDGTQMIPINPVRGVSVTVPFHDGEKLVYQPDMMAADFFGSDGVLIAHLTCVFNAKPIPGINPMPKR